MSSEVETSCCETLTGVTRYLDCASLRSE